MLVEFSKHNGNKAREFQSATSERKTPPADAAQIIKSWLRKRTADVKKNVPNLNKVAEIVAQDSSKRLLAIWRYEHPTLRPQDLQDWQIAEARPELADLFEVCREADFFVQVTGFSEQDDIEGFSIHVDAARSFTTNPYIKTPGTLRVFDSPKLRLP